MQNTKYSKLERRKMFSFLTQMNLESILTDDPPPGLDLPRLEGEHREAVEDALKTIRFLEKELGWVSDE